MSDRKWENCPLGVHAATLAKWEEVDNRFEPGQTRTIELVDYAGERKVYGFQGKVMGKLQASPPGAAPAKAKRGGAK